MAGSISSYGGAAPGAQNGVSFDGAAGAYELGGNLIEPTTINTSVASPLILTGLVAGDPSTDTLIVQDPTGQIKFITVQGLPDFWRSGIGDVLPDSVTDHADQISHAGNVGIGITDASTVRARLDVNGAVIHRGVALANIAANGAIGTAAATVDASSVLLLNQTTAGIALTLPAPTNAQSGRLLIVANTGTQPVTVGGSIINNGNGQYFVWSGAAWIPLGGAAAQDFWRTVTGATLPDGTTDTTDAIRRLGHTGIGGAAVTDVMPTVTTPTAANSFLHLSPNAAGRAQIMYGSNPHLYYTQRAVPVALNDYIEICSWTSGAQASDFILTVNVSDGGFAASKFYLAALDWHATTNAWRVLKPLSDGGAFNGNNYEILVNVNNGVVTLRLRRILGATVGTARIYLQVYNDPTTVLTELVGVGNDPAAYTQYDPFNSVDFWRSAAGTLLPDGTTDPSDTISHTGAVVVGSNTQVGTSQISVVSDTNTITDPIISAQANNLTQGVDVLWGGITKSGSNVNGDLGITAKGTGNIILQASVNGMTAATGNVGINTATPGAMLDVNGAVIHRAVTIPDLAANGAVGTAATTVDIASTLVLSQTTAGISMTIPNPTNTTAGRVLAVTNNGTVTTIVGGQILGVNQTLNMVWDGNSWNPDPTVQTLAWLLLGNSATVNTPYNDAGAQANNFTGTLDNVAWSAYTNAGNANAKSDIKLYTATPSAAAITAPVDIFHIRRNGQGGVVWPQIMSVALGHWWTDGNSRTRADFRLGNGAVNVPDFTNLSLFSQGGVGINGNGTTADWAWTGNGGISRGNGGALLGLMGANASNNVGPHIAAWTAADTFPLYYQLNWQHDNVSMLFDGYFDGGFKAAHTTRPYGIYKTADRLNFYGQSAVPAAAGSAWAQDLIMAIRYAGATLAGGELWFNNVVKNRRIVLFDTNAASDHQFYGFGINASMFRNQIDSTAAVFAWFAATAAATSNELMRLTGTGRLGIGTTAPASTLDVAGAEVLRSVTLANFAANAAIGTAAATVDIASTIIIPQTTAGITLTIPAPANAQNGRLLWISNTGTQSVTVGGQAIAAGRHMPYVWSGTAWIPPSAAAAAIGSIDTHTDVDTSTVAPVVGNTLVWNGTNWVPGAGTAAPDIQIYEAPASVTIDPLPVANQNGIATFAVTYTNPSATRSEKLLITFKPGEMRVRLPDEVHNCALRCNCSVGGVVQNNPADMDRRWAVFNPTGGRFEYTTATRDFVYTMTLAAGANVNLQMDYTYDVNTAPSVTNNGRLLVEPCQICVEGWLI